MCAKEEDGNGVGTARRREAGAVDTRGKFDTPPYTIYGSTLPSTSRSTVGHFAGVLAKCPPDLISLTIAATAA